MYYNNRQMKSLNVQGKREESNRYLIRVATEDDKQVLFRLFLQHFSTRTPLRVALYKKFPEMRPQDLLYWDIIKAHYNKETFGRGLSVVCFDSENDNEMVGATLVRDYSFPRQDLMKDIYLACAFKKIKKEMDKIMLPEDSTIFEEGMHSILDQWLFVVKQEHCGKGLLRRMVAFSDDLAREKGFQYSSCWATNCKTSKVVQKLGYLKVGEVDTKEFQMEGVKCFEDVEEEHRISRLWLKKLRPQRLE